MVSKRNRCSDMGGEILIMNVIEYQQEDPKKVKRVVAECPFEYYAGFVWYQPQCDYPLPYVYQVEDYLNGIMEWA